MEGSTKLGCNWLLNEEKAAGKFLSGFSMEEILVDRFVKDAAPPGPDWAASLTKRSTRISSMLNADGNLPAAFSSFNNQLQPSFVDASILRHAQSRR